jgi:hypothetical protein
MKIELKEIPGVDATHETVWKVRALVVNDHDPVREALARWLREHPNDHTAIMKVIKLAAQQRRVQNPKHVKKTANAKQGDVYEMIAYTGIARLMFFYDEENESIIICTNEYEKGSGSQDSAFARCAAFRELYQNQCHATHKPATKRPRR